MERQDANGVNAVHGWGGDVANEYRPANNLAGADADNIIDAIGNLTAGYSQYLGSRGWQIGSADTTSPGAPAGLMVQ